MPLRIEDYALIGDLETAGVVGRDGSIDWLCWPRFDSDACFAALLGDERHGRWLLAPSDDAEFKISRRYREGTLILETRFESAEGCVVVIDFMPPRGVASDVIRLIVGERGSMQLRSELRLRFGYGALVPWITQTAPDTWRAIAGPDMTTLRTQAPMRRTEDLALSGEILVQAGQRIGLTLTYSPSHLDSPPAPDVEVALAETEKFWLDWACRCQNTQRWSQAVIRSLITLRALIYAPTGGIVAAPTTSLPEQRGGTRNWDYRFCWLRDATATLLAVMNAGYHDEAAAWRDWLLRAIA